jgi:biopolymer transport protein TolR
VGISLESGGHKGARPAINITPLVDVVLVLLIIFMVVTPLLTRQFWVSVPKNEESAQKAPPGDEPLVLSVEPSGALKINREAVPADAARERLRRAFAGRGDHALYVSIDDAAPYGDALRAMDMAREAGASPIAIITDKL